MSETTPSTPNDTDVEDVPMAEAPERITINDVRACGFCVRGTKDWFAMYNLDFRDFLANGIDTESFLATGDEMAAAVVERACGQVSVS